MPRAVDILHGQVHLAGCIAEHAIAEHFGEQFVGRSIGIAALGADQREQARVDCARHAVSHAHLGAPHALNQRDHAARCR
ncbi:hypothetical protein PTKU46_26050 [Paraburkholderia terrae]